MPRIAHLTLGTVILASCGGEAREGPGAEPSPAREQTEVRPESLSASTVPHTPALTPRAEDVPPRDPAPASPGDTIAQGVVRVVGADPMAQVVIRSGADASGTAVGIIGPLRRELATLTGLEVRVWGEAAPNEVPRPRWLCGRRRGRAAGLRRCAGSKRRRLLARR